MSRFSKLEPGGDEQKPRAAEDDAQDRRLPRSRPSPLGPQAAEAEENVNYDYFYYCEKGDNLFFTGEPKNALTHYSRAIQQDGMKPYPWCMQVWCLVQMEQMREADLWAVRAEQMFPDHSATISLKAITYAARGMAQRALASSDFALTRGGDPMAWLARGFALLEGDNKNAYACFDKILELPDSKHDWKPMALSALILLRYRKYSQALKPLKQAIAIQENNFYLWLLMGRCFLRAGMTEQAKNAFEQALELNPRCEAAEKALRTYRSPLQYLGHSLRRLWPF